MAPRKKEPSGGPKPAAKLFRGTKRATKAELKREAAQVGKLVEMLLGFSHEGRFRILRALSAFFRDHNGDLR